MSIYYNTYKDDIAISKILDSVTAESIALEYEWDCFKEEADHNNNYFRTHHK